MAKIVLYRKQKTLRVTLTDPEFVLAERIIAAHGTGPLQILVASYLQQAGAEQRIKDRERLRTFVEQATDEERAAIFAAIPS